VYKYIIAFNTTRRIKTMKYIFYVDDKYKTARVRACMYVSEWVSVRTLVVYVCLCVAPAVSDHWEMAGDATAGSLDATPIEFFKIWWRSYCKRTGWIRNSVLPYEKIEVIEKKMPIINNVIVWYTAIAVYILYIKQCRNPKKS